MENQKVVVVVEEAAAARTALQWAVRNYVRGGDSITLLYVCPAARSRKKQRNLRLRGFHLALSFKDLCNGIAEAKVEIIVTEGEQGASVLSLVNQIGASTLVVGLHEHSFLYRVNELILSENNLKCRVLAIKQHPKAHDVLINTEFSQIEIRRLHKRKSRNCSIRFLPLSLGMIWRRTKRRKKDDETY
ncbi:uncharacterized protein LOC120280736 [Dioscorea cayenensis subsp. rotundata]|uniref:Uncharacterized protein LOC120280736 n=1 Tax=Dioscorea cayennensis subsp. rotundata TaxID=55577 RepID=A0AB40CUD2_DIOCR|nr:uncharacterized protein LOC120280736 [Dioscorea cayenensis subsp. rotundata]